MSGAEPVRALSGIAPALRGGAMSISGMAMLGHLERAFSKTRALSEPVSTGQRRQPIASWVLECP